MVEALPQGRLVVLAGSGHLSAVEVPEAFDAAVREFLDGLRLSRGARVRSIRGMATWRRTSRTAAAIGIASSAPTTPSSAPPSSTATTVIGAGTSTALRMTRG